MTVLSHAPSRPIPLFAGALLCWAAVILYAASNSVVSLLVDIGARHPVDGENVVTFANLLVLGSLVSLVPMGLMFWRDWRRETLRQINARSWAFLTLSAVLSSAITPGLFFFALENTSVTNVVIVSRLDPVLFLFAAALFLKERLDFWALLSALIMLAGAFVILVMKSPDGSIYIASGEVAAIAATVSFTLSTIVARTCLKEIPLGIFVIFRLIVGTTTYCVYMQTFTSDHSFNDMFQPVLLKWVWVYAILILILGQITWNMGLKYASSKTIALATSFSPVFAILIAMALLNEDPGPGFLYGIVFMIIGVTVAQYGQRETYAETPGQALELERKTNFKGV